MKKTITLIFAIALFACGGKKAESTAPKEEFAVQDNKPQVSSNDQIAEGKALVDGGDCKTCHHPTNKIVGPAHMDVAKKYEFTEANVKMLANKIVQGGQGAWGEIPMTAHPSISMTDAEKMARYVLSLDGEAEH